MTISAARPADTAYYVLIGISLCHFLNDVLQSMLSSIYPLLRAEFALDYWQIGLLTFAFQVTASLLQPVVGLVTDRRPMPMALPLGMAASLLGLLLLARVETYPGLVGGAMLIGIGSSVFHPESSRIARLASGGRNGLAQSLFQVGGNMGHAAGPLLAAFIVVPMGRGSISLFSVVALLGIVILARIGVWYGRHLKARVARATPAAHGLSRRKVIVALVVLAGLVFSKNLYTASLASYYTFFLIEKFSLTAQQSQLMLFLYLGAAAAGVMLGGLVSDRIGTLRVIWISILGTLPFALALPHVGLFWTGVMSVMIGLILTSAFTAIVVYAQELVPGRVGLIAGIFFGLAFGMGGIGAAALGIAADAWGIDAVYQICAFLPALGLLTIFLPKQGQITT